MPILPISVRIRSLEDTPWALASERNQHGLGVILLEALRGEHMLDFACPDAEGQRAKSSVGRRVAIAADDSEPGLRDAEFRADDVHDALVAAEHVKQPYTMLLAIARQRLKLQPGVVIHNRQFPVFCGNRVIHHRKRQVGPADLAAGGFDPRKSLRGGAFMHEVSVDIDQARFAGNLAHQVGFPDFLVHRSRSHGTYFSIWSPPGWGALTKCLPASKSAPRFLLWARRML